MGLVDWSLLTIIGGLAVLAALIAPRLGVAVAIVEIVLGIVAANFLGISVTDAGHDWLLQVAGVAGVLLTFLAGAEIDPAAMRKTWKANVSIGVLSFLLPFLAAWWFSFLVLGWTWDASLIAGVALSTTSVAVVYVVLIETGLSKTDTGKLILSACFITDLGTAIALSSLFARPNLWIIVAIIGTTAAALIAPRVLPWVFARLRDSPGEPSVKITIFLIFLLGLAADVAQSHAVLPAYILGLVLATTFERNRETLLKLRTIVLAFLTPFFFINAGLHVSLAAVVAGAGVIALLFAVKVGAKFAGVVPPAVRFVGRDTTYIVLLMSTGLTFGTISATFGLSAHLITGDQFSILVMTVMLTAIVPTIIAQRWFTPRRDEPSAKNAGRPPAAGEDR